MEALCIIRRFGFLLLLLVLTSCAPLPPKQFKGSSYSRLHVDWLPAHSRRLAYVIDLASRSQILKLEIGEAGETAYEALRKGGISRRSETGTVKAKF